ncbi:hypothetical protein [Streptomyces sp. NPDC006012]|uniref:hypothetical protein n=1 Tax=Streptomyces sp. NPDC006012 TaxID=3364739 RepID=UPI0036835D04
MSTDLPAPATVTTPLASATATAPPAPGSAVLTARIPGSKSITNRALLLAAAASGTTRLHAPLVSDDTLAFRTALTDLGVPVRSTPRDECWVTSPTPS